MTDPIKIFFCCAATPQDQALRDQLEAHIMVLKRLNEITLRLTRKLEIQKNWKYEQDHRFQTADLILLLISPDFICSNYHYGIEMSHALEKHAAGNALVISILLRPIFLEKLPLGGLQFLPRSGKAITQYRNRDAVCTSIIKEISQAVTTLLLRRQEKVLENTYEKNAFPEHLHMPDGIPCRTCETRNTQETSPCEICGDVLMADMPSSQESHESSDKQEGTIEAPQSAHIWSTRGFAYYEQGKFALAHQMFDAAIHLDNQYAKAYFGKGQVFYAERHLKQALDMFDQAIQYSSWYTEAWVRRGNVVDELGDTQLALQCYNRALRCYAHYAPAWSGKAGILYQLSDYYEALQAYRFAIDIDPSDALVWNGKGDVLCSLNNYSEALEAYENALQLDPCLTIAWHNKALMLIRLRRYTDALQSAEEAIRQQSNHPDHWLRKAEALKGLKRGKEAKKAQVEASRLRNTSQ